MICTTALIIMQLRTSSAIESFIKNHFPQKQTLVIISSNFRNWDESLQNLLQLERPKIIANPLFQEEIPSTVKNYITVEENVKTLLSSLSKIQHKINTRGNFLVILHKNTSITDDDLKFVFKKLWSDYIYNVVLFANWTSFVTWYPYQKENKCGKVVNLIIKQVNLFEGKIPNNFGGCSVNVTWNAGASWALNTPYNKTYPGFAITSLNTVAEKLNLTLKYLKENLDYFRLSVEAGSVQPLCDYVTKEKIDVAFIIAEIAAKYCEKIETTKSVLQYPQYFIFPPRSKIRNSGKMFTIFGKEIWSIILISVLIMMTVWKTLNEESYLNSLFHTIQLTLQCNVTKVPRKNLPRLVFFIFLFGITNINWFYVSQMSSVLTRPSYEPQLKSFSDIFKSNKKLKFLSFVEYYLKNYGNETCRKLMERRDKTADLMGLDSETWLDDFIETAEHGIMLGEIDLYKFKDRHKLQVISYDNIFTAAIVWSVRRGFPLKDKFNFWTARIVESGLMWKWMKDSAVILPKYNFSRTEDEETIALNVDHVFSVFVILLVGLLISSTCFVGEILLKHLQ